MDKEAILKYLETNSTENAQVLIDFLNNSEDLYSRKNEIGHITGSAFIVSSDLKDALLILHKKYDKWVAPGGHVDPNENSLDAAKRESGEEVGLSNLELLKPTILDIDIHRIPTGIKSGMIEPEHWHFDVRYLFKAQHDSVVDINLLEAKGFKWPDLEVLKGSTDVSISRLATKAFEVIETLKVKKTNKFKNK